MPSSVTLLGTDSLGHLVDASAATLSNSTTGNAATASAAKSGSALETAITNAKGPDAYAYFNHSGTGSAVTNTKYSGVSTVIYDGTSKYTVTLNPAITSYLVFASPNITGCTINNSTSFSLIGPVAGPFWAAVFAI